MSGQRAPDTAYERLAHFGTMAVDVGEDWVSTVGPLVLAGLPPETLNHERLARIARRYLQARRHRDGMFPDRLFADPAWDVLLELFASEIETRTVCVSDACVAANVPATTGLRWLAHLERNHLIERHPDQYDARRVFITLAPPARTAIAAWLVASFVAAEPA